jgi:phage tail sheath protein FI
MSVFISPGVYTTILDLSLYIPNLSTTIVGVVGMASKGPVNTPTYISNILAFVMSFGQPNPNYMGPYAALQFLRYGRQLYYVRVAGSSASRATVDMDEATTAATLTSGIAGPYTVVSADNNVLKIKFNDDGGYQTFTLTKGVRTAAQVAAEIAASIAGGAGNKDVTVSGASGYLSFVSTTLGGDSHIIVDTVADGSTGNLLFGFPSGGFTVNGVAATSGTITGQGVNAPYNIGGGNNTLIVSIDGNLYTITLSEGATQTSQNVVDDINNFSDLATYGLATVQTIAGNSVVRIASLTTGPTSSVLVSGTAGATALGFDTSLHIGVAETAASRAGTVAGPWALGANNVFHLTVNGTLRNIGLTPGLNTATDIATTINAVIGPTGYNEGLAIVMVDGKVKISTLTTGAGATLQANTGYQYAMNFSTTGVTGTGAADTRSVKVDALTFGTHGNTVTVRAARGQNAGTFKLFVYDGDATVEVWDNLTKADPNAASFVETVINDNSTWITVTNDAGTANFPDPGVSFALSGGTDGIDDITDGDYIGQVNPGSKTGMQIFANQEDYDLNLLMVPGISSPDVINEMLLLCATRGDCMALVDPPFGLSVQQVTDWHNGYGSYSDHQSFNSLYGALYWPWLQIYDAVNKQNVWVPPSGLIAGVYAYTDYTTETWFAPAGLNRGHLLQPLRVEHSADLGERDLLYGNQNAVNPIVNFQKDGITVWGQRSLQRKPSALDRVNVVRLVLYLRKVIATAVKYLVFEPNDPVTWATFTNLVAPYLESVKQRRGLIAYKVICDASTNPPDAMDRNEMHAVCALKPTKSAEFIEIKFAVVNQGARFEDLTY